MLNVMEPDSKLHCCNCTTFQTHQNIHMPFQAYQAHEVSEVALEHNSSVQGIPEEGKVV